MDRGAAEAWRRGAAAALTPEREREKYYESHSHCEFLFLFLVSDAVMNEAVFGYEEVLLMGRPVAAKFGSRQLTALARN